MLTNVAHAADQYDQETEEQAIDSLRRLCIDLAIHAAPVHNLAEMLALMPTEELAEIAEETLGDPCPKERDKLISRLCEALADPETVRSRLIALDVVGWQFFRQILENSQRQDEQDVLLYLAFPHWFMLVQAFYDQERLTVIVPDEIRAAYESLLPDGLLDEREFMERVDQFACASAQYYGAISLNDFVSLFNGYHRRKLNAEEALEILGICGVMTEKYLLDSEYIAHPCFLDMDSENIEGLMGDARRYPRHFPGKSEFARYIDAGYVPGTPQLSALKRFLAELADRELQDEAEDLAERMSVKFLTDWGYLETVSELFTETPWLKDLEVGIKRQTFLHLARDLFENTRSWALNGNTRKEAQEMGLLNDLDDSEKAFEKTTPVGRNALCPCGSGKKYKKCCGRDA